jgi:hypothetical protein
MTITVQIDHTTPDKHKIQANKIKDLRTQTPTTKTRGENTNSLNKILGVKTKCFDKGQYLLVYILHQNIYINMY